MPSPPRADEPDDARALLGVMYRRMSQEALAAVSDLSPTINALCDAVADAKLEVRAVCDRLVDDLRRGGGGIQPPAMDFRNFEALVTFYNESMQRFIMIMRGVLKLLATTRIREVSGDRAALERVCALSEGLAAATERLAVRARALASSHSETKRKTADAARRLSRLAEAEFYRRVLACMYATDHDGSLEGGEEEELWAQARAWAVQRHPDRPAVMPRMHSIFTALLKHKRAVDWEFDLTWAYEHPRTSTSDTECRPSGDGTPGTRSA